MKNTLLCFTHSKSRENCNNLRICFRFTVTVQTLSSKQILPKKLSIPFGNFPVILLLKNHSCLLSKLSFQSMVATISTENEPVVVTRLKLRSFIIIPLEKIRMPMRLFSNRIIMNDLHRVFFIHSHKRRVV